MPGALTVAVKRQITKDWALSFPKLAVYKPMWLLKRNGPLLVGIALDRTRLGDVYIPTFHVHNLLTPSPFIVLSLFYPLPSERTPRLIRQIKVVHHQRDSGAAIVKMRELVPELWEFNLRLSRLIAMHHEFIEQRRDYALALCSSSNFADVILLLQWAGYTREAASCFEGACRIMSSWQRCNIDLTVWRSTIESLLDRSRMEEVLEEEIEKHKLSHIPVYDLIADAPPEPNIVDVYKRVWGLR